MGYVGLSNAVLLAQQNQVIGVDIQKDRVDAINARKSPLIDAELTRYLATKTLSLSASTDLKASITGADYIIVSTPTNYDEATNFFDTSSVEEVISEVTKHEPTACIVVKSTIPVGFTDQIRKRLGIDTVIFAPEFLREGSALYDNLYPDRIIVGEKSDRARNFANLLAKAALKENIKILLTDSREAEAAKLFANTYLAMRVAFFNEVDSYAMSKKLNIRDIIQGVSSDARIGDHYNNPSFGYGGYCLPKDTKQLLANYDSVPQNLIQAIVDANSTRKEFLANEISARKPETVGVFRLVMKHNSDNFRESSVQSIIKLLISKKINVIIYEPKLNSKSFLGVPIENNLEKFKSQANVILANRMTSDLSEVKDKVFTRDIFGAN